MERYEILYIWQKKQSKNNFEEKKRKKWRKEIFLLSNKYKAKNKKIKEENEWYCRWKRNFEEKNKCWK